MKDKLLFSEAQRFRQWWVWLILFGSNGLLLFAVYYQLICDKPFGNKPMSDEGLVLTTSLIILFSAFFALISLDTKIRSDGIYVRFFPFRIKFKHYNWSEINQVYVRKYRPIAEFGGWGIRGGVLGFPRALNISGNKGLQLEFKNGKSLLIGTRKMDELEQLLKELNLK